MMRKNWCLILVAVLALGASLGAVGCQGEAEPPESPPAAELFLEINEPADESVVAQSLLTVTGSTLPEATVSVNGEIIDVHGQGNFAAAVTLEVGPNVIEIIASDDDGAEVYRILTVIYQP